MRWLPVIGVVILLAVPASAQTKKAAPPTQKRTQGRTRGRAQPPAPLAALKQAVPEMVCPTPLGIGVATRIPFCDVLTGREPASGILITLPPHKGPLTLTFDLHNRHTYSEEEVRSQRGYRRYTATVGVLTMDNNLISRAVVQNEFRTAADLVDRVGGGAGPGGVKAVAPTGSEPISLSIPEGVEQVSVLGEKLTMERLDGTATYSQPDRPIADISNVMIEYRPGPAPKTTKPKR